MNYIIENDGRISFDMRPLLTDVVMFIALAFAAVDLTRDGAVNMNDKVKFDFFVDTY